MKKFSFLILGLCFLLTEGCGETQAIPAAEKGSLDLTGMVFTESGLFRMDGEWEFYWNRLLEPGDFNSNIRPDLYQKVPGVWSDFSAGGNKLPAAGYSTYRLKIQTVLTNHNLGLKIPIISTCYRVYIDGVHVADGGTVSTNLDELKEVYIQQLVFFHNTNREIELVIQAANKSDIMGGMYQGVYFGTEKAAVSARESGLFFELVLIGALLIMGMYHFVIFYKRRSERASLFFGHFCFAIALRATVSGECILGSLIPAMDWIALVKIAFITIYLSSFFFMVFFMELYKALVWKPLIYINAVVSIIYSLFTLVAPTEISILLFPVFEVVMIGSSVYILVSLIRFTANRLDGALVILIAFIVFFASVVNDLLYYNRLIISGFYLPLGLLVFVFFQTVVLSNRFANALSSVENISEMLELKVRDRTLELESERNKLQVKNELMRRDLEMARFIQKQFIPRKSPSPKIAFHYQPMELVGGDFFDFVQFSKNKIGILVSDVSGHGVPAAFVTSMIKSYMLQFSEVINSPAEFLLNLNELLYNQTAGNFVTAFYCIFDPASGSITYSNAGHIMPMILSKNGVRLMKTVFRGVPLAIFDNKTLISRREVYQNNTMELEKGEKLLLYTDGLCEAVNLFEKETIEPEFLSDFGTDKLFDVLQAGMEMSPEQLVNSIVDNLVSFRGGNTFDDDICIICMDI